MGKNDKEWERGKGMGRRGRYVKDGKVCKEGEGM